MLLPYFWMVSSSLKTGAEVFELPIRWIPQVLQWANYPNALSRGSFGIYFFNSAFVALAVMVGNLLFCSLAGYGLAKFRFPYRELCFRLDFEHADAPAGDHAGADLPRGASAWPREQLWRLDRPAGWWTPSASSSCVSTSRACRILSSRRPGWTDAASSASSGASSFPTASRARARSPCSRSATPGISSSGRSSWRRDDALKTFPLGLAQMEGIDSAAYHEIMAIAVMGMIPAALDLLVLPAGLRPGDRSHRPEGMKALQTVGRRNGALRRFAISVCRFVRPHPAGQTSSPVEAVEAFLQRIEALNPRLSAFLTLTRGPRSGGGEAGRGRDRRRALAGAAPRDSLRRQGHH